MKLRLLFVAALLLAPAALRAATLHQLGNRARRVWVIVSQIAPITTEVDPLPVRSNLLKLA